MCIAKGITGGYMPLAATLTTDKVYQAFLANPEENKTFFHGHTYTGNQLSCSVALKNIELIEKRELIKEIQQKAKELSKYLMKLTELPNVGQIRQRGLMVGVEIVKDKLSKETFSST